MSKKIKKNKYKKKKLFFYKKNKVEKIKINKYIQYLYKNKNLKRYIYLNEPSFKIIKYPFLFNFQIINKFLRKK